MSQLGNRSQAARRPAGAILLVCVWAAAACAQEGTQPAQQPLDLNTATAEQLQKLPGIGPKTASAIVRFREKSGPFRRVEDLLAIRGITKKKLEKLRPLVTVRPVGEPSSSPPPFGIGLARISDGWVWSRSAG
jgi:competence protein ComEA